VDATAVFPGVRDRVGSRFFANLYSEAGDEIPTQT